MKQGTERVMDVIFSQVAIDNLYGRCYLSKGGEGGREPRRHLKDEHSQAEETAGAKTQKSSRPSQWAGWECER